MRLASGLRWLAVCAALFVARDAPARALRGSTVCLEPVAMMIQPPARVVSWAKELAPIEVIGPTQRATIRLYREDGEVDDAAREALERVAAGDAPPHKLALRTEQLMVRAAYHFGGAPISIVSGYRWRASRHGTGEAIDFKVKGVSARQLAAYLRGTPRAGVGVYTNPKTQFVHLDVRDQSFHWVDASPPGVHWHEAAIRDPGAAKRDAAWTASMDLP